MVPGPSQEWEIWGSESRVKICIACCNQTITDSRMFIIVVSVTVILDSLYVLSNGISNSIIADPIQPPLPKITFLTSYKLLWPLLTFTPYFCL